MDSKTIEKMRQELPPAFGRTAINELMPGVIDRRTLANLAVLGEGPPSVRIRHKVVYERDSFLDWLERQMR